MDIIEFYKTNSVDDDFDEISYQNQRPKTKNFYQPFCELNGITDRARLFFHYIQYVKPGQKSRHDYYHLENLTIVNKGCHVFSYEPCNDEEDLFYRQKIAVDSYDSNKIENISIYNVSKINISYANIIDYYLDKTFDSNNRQYCFLNDLLDFASKNIDDNDYIIYTNSDCYIESNFYEFILSSSYNYIEFFRIETTSGSVVGQNKDGIDGFAIKKSVYLSLKDKKILPDNLIIGSPYWDAVFSNIAKKHITNTYQDTKRLKHTKHKARWKFSDLDDAGRNNLNVLNNLYENKIIDCRKAEITQDNLIIRIFDESTNYDIVKPIIMKERFGSNESIDYDYNYLFIEIYLHDKKLTDSAIGTTAGTRIHIEKNQDTAQNIQKTLQFYQKLYQRSSIIGQYSPLSSNVEWKPRINPNPELGVVLCFFGDDEKRINATKYAIDQLSKQTVWHESKIVFIELINQDTQSNFNFTEHKNINHIQIIQYEKNKDLFQKECLWNIGAKFLADTVDNYVFIDADTFPQNTHVFAKANKILQRNPNIVYQLGDYLITKKDNIMTRIQMLWNFFSTLEAQKDYCFNPCGGFAISKSIFDQIDGFNPYGFLYGGDILFLYEIDNRSHAIYDKFIHNKKIFNNLFRKTINSNIIVKNDDNPLIHIWHGDHKERPYGRWGEKFNNLDFALHRDIVLGDNGLLEWRSGKTPDKLINFFSTRY